MSVLVLLMLPIRVNTMWSEIIGRSKQTADRWLCETCVSPLSSGRETRDQQPIRKDETVWKSQCERYVLWIDGVGAFQLFVGQSFLIGGPTLEHPSADICLLANISRKHATLSRDAEDWFIRPHSSTVVSGRTVSDRALLKSGDEIRLAERVRLGFRIPSMLSGSAVIDFESPHRPAQSVNGIILMTDTCLLGPRSDHHVCCPDWPDMVVLFTQAGQLKCRSAMPLNVNDVRVRDAADLHDGAIVTGHDLRFRVERLKNSNG